TIQLNNALNVATGTGINVAIIDTGVDYQHPTLQGVLLGGRNYVGRTPVPSELDDPAVAQSTTSILDQSTTSILDQSTTSILDQFSLNHLPGEFGHGTMMAGLVHLVAPRAKIIPLKAFDADGTGSEWNIIRAIYDAVAMNADVISMSFSATQGSKLLEAAIHDANSHGVALIAASGNDNSQDPTYPAAYAAVSAIGALDLNDQKAGFSNFAKYIDVSAPGVNLISTFPGGHWAMGSGTSDATPLVSGLYALVSGHRAPASVGAKIGKSRDPLTLPATYQGKLGKGRINAYDAVRK